MTWSTDENAPARSGNSGEGNGYLGGPAETSIPAIHEMTPRGRDVALAYYTSGYTAGLDAGRREAEADMDAAWRETARKVAALGSPQSVSFSTLCERRGDHERAARARAHEARLGLREAS